MANAPSSHPLIPATTEVLQEAEALSADILKDIELNQSLLSLVVLKGLRLARILNDFDMQQIFEWESGGYPSEVGKVSQPVWMAGLRAGRLFYPPGSTQENGEPLIYLESIEQLEITLRMGETSLQVATDPNISIASANEYQRVHVPAGNSVERTTIRTQMQTASSRLAARRTLIYEYTARKYYELKFAGVADDVFGRMRHSVDASIGLLVPDAVRKFTAVYDNLASDNPEDWANATHSCRRILQDLADAVFPAQDDVIIKDVKGQNKEIRLGPDNYINRLIAYIEDRSNSDRFNELVGSHLDYIGNRLDALFQAAQKGSHSTVTREEADRCVIYTYIVVGDILSLGQSFPQPTVPGSIEQTASAPVEGL